LGGAALITRYLEGMLFGFTPLGVTTGAESAIFLAVATARIPAGSRSRESDPLVHCAMIDNAGGFNVV
jgi:hypothetical protein